MVLAAGIAPALATLCEALAWPAPVFASRKYPQAHRIWHPAITSTVRALCRQARFTWEMVGHQGIVPRIPVWKAFARGHQRVSLNTYARRENLAWMAASI